MRIIYKASLIIMLNDIADKMPITNAVILCNGKQNPYVRKDEGYYVFSNLYPGNYKIEILCSGYVATEFECNLTENESKYFMLDLPFESVNPKLLNIPRFEFRIKNQNKPLIKKNIKITLKVSSKLLKIVQKSNQGDQIVFLNAYNDPLLSPQRYMCKVRKAKKSENAQKNKPDSKPEESKKTEEKKPESAEKNANNANAEKDEENNKKPENAENSKANAGKNDKEESKPENAENSKASDEKNDKEDNKSENTENPKPENAATANADQKILILNFDKKLDAYVLQEPLKGALDIGTSLLPYWELKTDSQGKLVLPFSSRFMKTSKLKFEIELENQKKEIIADLKYFDTVYKNLDVEIKIK